MLYAAFTAAVPCQLSERTSSRQNAFQRINLNIKLKFQLHIEIAVCDIGGPADSTAVTKDHIHGAVHRPTEHGSFFPCGNAAISSKYIILLFEPFVAGDVPAVIISIPPPAGKIIKKNLRT